MHEKWAAFKVDRAKGAKGNATWAMREALQARAAATASNRTLETIKNSGGHTLTVIRMPDERTKPIISRDDGTHDMLLCKVCGKRGSMTTLRVFPCGDTVTARLRSVNLRKRDVERVDALAEKVKTIPGREKQVADLEATQSPVWPGFAGDPRTPPEKRRETKA